MQDPSRSLPRTFVWALLLLVVCLPVAEPALITIAGKAVRAVDVAFVILLGCTLAAPRRTLLGFDPRRIWPVFPVLAALILASARSPEPWKAVPDLLRVTYSLCLFVLLAQLRLDARARRVVARSWLGAASVVFFLGIASWLGVALGLPQNAFARANSANLGPTIVRAVSTLTTNALPLYLQLSLAFGLWLLGSPTSDRDRLLARVALGLGATLAPLTFSRGLAGALVSLAAMAAVSPDALPGLWRWRRFLGLGAAVLTLAVLVLTWWSLVPLRRDPASGGLRLNERPNAYSVLHRGAVRMISAHPISGVGPGRFGTAFETFTSAKERQAAWPPLPVSLNWDPHSTWLGWAAETGLVGLAAWLVLFGWILRELLASRSWAARLAAAATLGLLANGFHVEVVHLKFVWAFLGLALGAAWASEGDKLIATGA